MRANAPLKGYWSLPGGAVEPGEKLAAAVRREVREETGLRVEPGPIAAVFERITRDRRGRALYHYVLIDYLCRVKGGRLAAADDAGAARWFRPEELGGLRLTSGTLGVIRKAFQLQ